MRRHVPAAAANIVAAREETPQDVDRSHTDGYRDRDISIVGEDPVDTWPQGERGANLSGFVALAAERHRPFAHPLEHPLANAERARHEHHLEDLEQLLF